MPPAPSRTRQPTPRSGWDYGDAVPRGGGPFFPLTGPETRQPVPFGPSSPETRAPVPGGIPFDEAKPRDRDTAIPRGGTGAEDGGEEGGDERGGTEGTGGVSGRYFPTFTSRPWPQIPGIPWDQFAGPNPDLFGLYMQRTPEEIAALKNVSALAQLLGGAGQQLYGIGLPAYSQAIDYYRTLLGGSKSALSALIAPEAEAASEVYGGARRQVEAGPLRGGSRDQALAELARTQAGTIAGLIPAARREAAGVAGQLGLQGASLGSANIGASAGIEQGLAAAETGNRQFAITAEQANRFQLLSAALQDKGLDLSAMLGLRGQDITHELGLGNIGLGYAGLDVQKELGLGSLGLQQQQLGLQQSQFDWSKTFQQQLFDWQRAFQTSQLNYQREANKGQKWGGLLGTALQGGLGIAANAALPGSGAFTGLLSSLLSGNKSTGGTAGPSGWGG